MMKPNITEWSNNKLTKSIAEFIYPDAIKLGNTNCSWDVDKVWVLLEVRNGFNVDYCNNWNHLIPLMIKHDVYYPISSKANQIEMCIALYTVLLAKSEEG